MSLHRAAFLALCVALASSQAVDAAGPTVVHHGPRNVRTVALTIDDGWDPARCERMYRTLVATGVPATWFPNAVYVKKAPATWRLIASRFPIGNHTFYHPDLTKVSDARLRREILRDQRVIEAVTGQPMARLLRPPFGAYDGRVLRIAGELGYGTIVLWDATDADSSPRTTVRSGLRAASRGGPGSIILMHCGPAITPDLLPGLIRHYACAGYTFATVEGLLAHDPGVRAQVDCGTGRGDGSGDGRPTPAPDPTVAPPGDGPGPSRPVLDRLEGLIVAIVDDVVGILRGTSPPRARSPTRAAPSHRSSWAVTSRSSRGSTGASTSRPY